MPTLVAACLGGTPYPAVEGLGAVRFADREAAARTLRRVEPVAALGVLRQARATHPDPEVRHRSGLLYRYHRERVLDWLEPVVWIDMMWWDPAAGRFRWDAPEYLDAHARAAPYLAVAWYWTGHDALYGGDRWPRYRRAMRMYLGDRLDAGDDPRILREILDELRQRERNYSGLGPRASTLGEPRHADERLRK